MATLGRWVGGTTSLTPTESWAAPNGLFPTESRNDGSAYSFTSSTSTLTLPSSDLADGYLIIAAFEFEDTSNGRFNPQGQIVQTGGTGNFTGPPASGYSRDTSEDRAFVVCWGFVDNPSASATFQFQWKRDVDAPTGGTVTSHVSAIPLSYADVAFYTSTDTASLGGTTRTQLTGFSGTDGGNISISGDAVTVTGDNKRYLILAGVFWEGRSGRTQRQIALAYDGSADAAAQAYIYSRSTANDEHGAIVIDLIETTTANRTIEIEVRRGPTAIEEGGADLDGSVPSLGDHAIVVMELNDAAEVYRAHDGTGGQRISTTTAPVDFNIARSGDIDFNDAASFTRESDSAVNCEVAMDVLFGANIWAARTGGIGGPDGERLTSRARCTVNGVEDQYCAHGHYMRGEIGTGDTWGWGANPVGFAAVSADDNIGLSVQAISGTEGADDTVNQDETLAGSVGFWAVNLDSLDAAALVTRTLSLDGALQEQRALAASLNATVQQSLVRNASIDGALQQALSEAMSLNAAVEALRIAIGSLDSSVQDTAAENTSLDAGVAGAQVGTASLDVAIATARLAAGSVDAAISQAATLGLSLEAAVQAGESVGALLDAVVGRTVSITTSLDAFIDAMAAGETVVLDLDAVLRISRSLETSLSAAVMALRQAALALDGAIQRDGSSSVSLSAGLAKAHGLFQSIDAFLLKNRLLAVSLNAALRAQESLTLGVDAALGLPFSPRAPHRVPGRPRHEVAGRLRHAVVGDEAIGVGDDGRVYVIPPRNTVH